jgi:hypothetical protein
MLGKLKKPVQHGGDLLRNTAAPETIATAGRRPLGKKLPRMGNAPAGANRLWQATVRKANTFYTESTLVLPEGAEPGGTGIERRWI